MQSTAWLYPRTTSSEEVAMGSRRWVHMESGKPERSWAPNFFWSHYRRWDCQIGWEKTFLQWCLAVPTCGIQNTIECLKLGWVVFGHRWVWKHYHACCFFDSIRLNSLLVCRIITCVARTNARNQKVWNWSAAKQKHGSRLTTIRIDHVLVYRASSLQRGLCRFEVIWGVCHAHLLWMRLRRKHGVAVVIEVKRWMIWDNSTSPELIS